MSDFVFGEVTRERSKLRMALCGVSGAGKTLSALYIAYGITGDWKKVALIDTEHGRGKFYADRQDFGIPTGKYLYCELEPPYSPDRYIAAVKAAASVVGEDGVIIIDSFSHAWNNEGGVLDIKSEIARTTPGKNDYTAWGEAGKYQNNLVNTILAVNAHTIVTLRAKMAYAMEVNERGKTVPVKIGLAPVQRDDTEYEFDIVMNIGRDHIAVTSKDTTFLDGFADIITPELGKELKDWLDKGVNPERCSDCGKIIRPTDTRSIAQIVEGSQKCYGRKLCISCVSKLVRQQKQEANANAAAAVSG